MSCKRALAALLLAFASLSSVAATLAERSPFTQGIWWDASRAGNGFDIFNVGNDVSILWYTYDAASRPIWYSAQGPLSGTTTAPLSLMEHRWADGKHASATAVGTIRLEVRNPERMVATVAIGANAVTWNIQPFTAGGIRSEVDHTGTWFDPRTAGWGLSFLEQGDVTGGILFTYDAAGLPTWLSGFGRERGSVEMFAFEGPCQSCAARPPTSRSIGRLGWSFEQEWQMTLRNQMTASMAAGVAIEGARVFQLSRQASLRKADWQLASFTNEATLRDVLAAGLLNVATPPVASFSAAPPAALAGTFSTTNVQESGIDEADLVKTDGQYAYTFVHETGSPTQAGGRKPVVRIAQIGADGSSVTLRGTYPLASGPASAMHNAGLYLHGTTLTAVTGSQPEVYFGLPPMTIWVNAGAWRAGTTNIEVMSLPTPASPSTLWRAEIDGYLLTSRRIGDRLYVVSRFSPPPGITPASATLGELLPRLKINGGPASALLQPSMVYLPPMGDRPAVADMVVVTAIDLANPRVAQSFAVLGTAETVYASPQNLYVATSRFLTRAFNGSLRPEPYVSMTDLHQIRLGTTDMSVVASGTIEGFFGGDIDKAAFRLSEHNGKLRAVSSSQLWLGTKNRLTILEPSSASPGLLKTVSVLPNAQRPESLGKPNELLYGTRFIGDRLYAVTFLSIDPLYVIDLSNPADPRIAGQVELPGFSDYLHPLPNGLLLGFGKDACPANTSGDGQWAWYQGLQLALFDVSNAAQPRVVQQMLMGKRGSTSALLSSHHAFSALAQADGSTTIAIPARIHDGSLTSTACTSTSYQWKESGLMRFDLRGIGAAARLTQMPSLVTHSLLTSATPPPVDAAADGGRSIVFRNGTIYVGAGLFWRQDNAGNTSGPF